MAAQEEGPGLKPTLIRSGLFVGNPRLKPWVTNPTLIRKDFLSTLESPNVCCCAAVK